MTGKHSLRDLLHRATHRVPAVPAHAERPSGHQGSAPHGGAGRPSAAHHRSWNRRFNRKFNHTSARPPHVLAAWQNRIAALFGQEPR
jgi:hypothetical protein